MHKLFKKTSGKDSKKGTSKDKKDKKSQEAETGNVPVHVAVTLHHRAELSLEENRIRLGREAYHWGLLLMSEATNDNRCAAFDVSDAAVPDPNTRRDRNPNRDWHFRIKNPVNPQLSGSLIGRVIIGEMGSNMTVADVVAILQSVPVPLKDTQPPESCVTWTLNAVSALQTAGLAYAFDVKQFGDWALSYADSCMAAPSPMNVCNYADTLSQ